MPDPFDDTGALPAGATTSGGLQTDADNAREEARASASYNVKIEHKAFRCSRGYDLYTTTFTPSVRRSPCCLVFHHGLSDHSSRHRDVLIYLCAEVGMPVYTYDAHGHGRSGPDDGPQGRAFIFMFDDLLNDLLDFTKQVVIPAETASAASCNGSGPGPTSTAPRADGAATTASASGPAPGSKPRIYLFGYSMGGLCTILAVATTADAEGRGSLYEGLVLSSCLTDALYGDSYMVRVVKLVVATLLRTFVPYAAIIKRNSIEAGIRDTSAIAQMAADPLWYRGKFKTATIYSLLWGCQWLHRAARRITVPIYAQHGTKDIACNVNAMREHLARVRSKDLTFNVVEGGFHDLHHDPETPRLLKDMVSWLKAHAK